MFLTLVDMKLRISRGVVQYVMFNFFSFHFPLCAFLPTINTVGTCSLKQFRPCLTFVIPLIVNRVIKVVTVLYSFQAFCQTERFGILVLPASLEFCSQFLILLYCCISDSNVWAPSVWVVLLLTHFI